MAATRKVEVEVYGERSRIPADGTATKIFLRYEVEPGSQVTLTLSRGSFSPTERVREATFPVENKEVHFTVYAPHRPGVGWLTGGGVRHRLDFVASSFTQGLVFEWIPTLLIAAVLALGLRSSVVASFYIPSGSMEDTLRKGDLLIADKLSYKLLHHDPQRGDVMIFKYPAAKEGEKRPDYIKRIIGLPGDVIEVRDGAVYVNGEQLEEEYIKEQPFQDYGPVQVPDDQFFAMGDNRNRSADSRVWGFVPRENLEGRALFVFWPPTRAKIIGNGLAGDYVPEPEPLGLEGQLR